MKLHILAIGVHPDDVELGCGGILLKHALKGQKTGIIDLTQGEMGTRGTIETRYQEASDAAKILKTTIRENLKMRDGFFRNDEEHQLKLIQAIRKYQPEIVLANSLSDRHPDHGRAGKLIADACFLAGLRKIETNDNGVSQEAWRPKAVFHYIQDIYHQPDFIIDISDTFSEKIESVLAYKTQFTATGSEDPMTKIAQPGFVERVKARATDFGQRIGADYGEGFTFSQTLGIADFDQLFYPQFP